MTLSATLHLKRVFLAPVDNFAGYVTCGSSGSIGGGGQRTSQVDVEGSFRTYANGNTRVILGSAVAKTHTVTLRALTAAQVIAVQAMVGKTCLFRDTYGRRKYGSFLVTTQVDMPLSGVANSTLISDIGITFQEVSYTEGV